MSSHIDKNNRPAPRIPNVRAEKLRARGTIAAKRAVQLSAETVRRARLAYRGLRVHSEDQRTAARSLSSGVGSSGSGRMLAIVVVMAGAGLGLLSLFLGPYAAVGSALLLSIGASLIALRAKRSRAEIRALDALGIARAFDAFFAARAARLTETTVSALRALGGELSEVLAQLPAGQSSGVWTPDDLAFLRSVVTDYLPNAIDPYLALRRPTDQQKHLLAGQIERMRSELRSMLARLEAARGERLSRNATFLERKLGS